tara:strand:+ start:636 stop:851 length:216 start_codon:yes stop_codon:yes gene_type:complete
MKTPYKMKGMDFGNSPMPKKDNDQQEKINDLESELFNLREDLKGGSVKLPPLIESGKRITNIQAQLKKLKA